MSRSALRLAELAGAWGLAVAAPVLDLLGRSPTYFVALRASPAEIAALALTLALLPPLLLALLPALLERASARGAELLHASLLGLLGVALAAAPLARWGLGGAGLLVAVALGALLAVAFLRAPSARALVRFTAPAAIVVPAAFLLAAPLQPILKPPPTPFYATHRVERPAPIVFLVFDELPLAALLDAPGSIDAGRFPSFARLAAGSTWYTRAVTPGSATDLAVPALLSGRRPRAVDVPPVAPSHPRNLFSLLPADYRVAAFENVTALCQPSRCGASAPAPGEASSRLGVLLADAAAIWLRSVTPPKWATALPAIDGRWGDYWGLLGAPAARLRPLDAVRFPELAFRDFLGSLGPAGRPWLAFAHLNLPHMPHQFLPTGQRYAAGREALPATWGDASAALLAEQRHLLATGHADRLLGALLDRLEASGLADDALLVVTSDHGVSFRAARSARGPDAETLGEIAPVPLFVRSPGQRDGRRDDRPVELIDVLPLVAKELGLALPPEVEGTAEPTASRTHRLMDSGGAVREFSPDEAAAALARAVARKVSTFGSGSWEPLFRAGPRPDLFNRPVGPRAARAFAGRVATVDQAAALETVDPRAPFLPALVTGALGEAAPGKALAVALGGRIAAVVEPSGRRWEALLPWTWLRPGRNGLRLFLVDPAIGDPALAELDVGGAPTLVPDGLRLGGGPPVPLTGGPHGRIEQLSESPRGLYLRGAVEGGGRGEDRTELMAFDGGELVARSPAGGAARPDLAAQGWRGATEFSLDVDLPPGDRSGLRVVAVRGGGGATELRLPAVGAAASP